MDNSFMGGDMVGATPKHRVIAAGKAAKQAAFGTADFSDEPLPEDARKAFLTAVMENKVITSAMVHPNDVGMVFMPILLGGLSAYSEDALQKIQFIYGIVGLDYTFERGINGWPIFGECRVMLKSDWEGLKPQVDVILAVKDAAVNGDQAMYTDKEDPSA